MYIYPLQLPTIILITSTAFFLFVWQEVQGNIVEIYNDFFIISILTYRNKTFVRTNCCSHSSTALRGKYPKYRAMSCCCFVISLLFSLSHPHSARLTKCFVLKGLVSKPEVQGEADEAAELPGRPEARVLPRPEEDEGAGREAGSRGAWTLLLLWR